MQGEEKPFWVIKNQDIEISRKTEERRGKFMGVNLGI
jgi:hypothetical protein